MEDQVVFWVLLVLGVLNLLGVGLFHYQYAHEDHKAVWYKDKEFWLWTVYIFFIGVAYDVVRLAEYFISKKRG